jgi:putative copper resistance protein D
MASYVTAYGTCFMACLLLPPVPGLKKLVWFGAAIALITGAGWFWLQAADFAGAYDVQDVIAALPITATDTRFGGLLLSRLGLLLLAATSFQFGAERLALLLSGAGVVAESWLGHGGAMTGPEGDVLLMTSVFHITAAASWLGALPALFIALRRLPLEEARRAAQAFSPYGIICVVTLLITAAIQYLYLINSVTSLFTTAYGLTASVKIAGFATLITLATLNRHKLTPALTSESGRQQLVRSISAEITLGLIIFLAAGLLLQFTPPAMSSMVG